jgi:hypothetical protein
MARRIHPVNPVCLALLRTVAQLRICNILIPIHLRHSPASNHR